MFYGDPLLNWWLATERAGGRDVGDVGRMEVWRLGLASHFPAVFLVRRKGRPARARRNSAVSRAIRRDPALRRRCRGLLAGYPACLPRWLTDALCWGE